MFLILSTVAFGQQIDFGDIPEGREKKVVMIGDYDNASAIGDLILKKVDKTKTGLAFDFSRSGTENFLIKIIRDNVIVHKQKVRGPNGIVDFSKETVMLDSWISEGEPTWWWGVLLVAYCCLELQVSQTTNSDGTSSVTGTLTFDCDCFTISPMVTTENGDTYEGVTQIQVTPLY